MVLSCGPWPRLNYRHGGIPVVSRPLGMVPVDSCRLFPQEYTLPGQYVSHFWGRPSFAGSESPSRKRRQTRLTQRSCRIHELRDILALHKTEMLITWDIRRVSGDIKRCISPLASALKVVLKVSKAILY